MASNGQLTRRELTAVYTGRRALLARGSAASGMNSVNLHLSTTKPGVGRYTSNGPMSDYRTYGQQVLLRGQWCARGACGNAAVPGTSNHGWGTASDGQRWKLTAYGRAADWAGSDAPWESWHSHNGGGYRRPDPGPDPRYPVLRAGSGGVYQARSVARLQRLLRAAGWKVTADGVFGGHTKTAVFQFQKRAGWKHPNGVVGKTTWIRLAAYARRKR